jgi:hypothetical protein
MRNGGDNILLVEAVCRGVETLGRSEEELLFTVAQAAAKRVAYTLVDQLPAQAGNAAKTACLLSNSAAFRRPCL